MREDGRSGDYIKRRISTLRWDMSMITDEDVLAKKRRELEEYMQELEHLDGIEENQVS